MKEAGICICGDHLAFWGLANIILNYFSILEIPFLSFLKEYL